MIDFNHPSTLATARAHVASMRWRVAVGAIFAVGAALVLGSWQIGAAWFLALSLATAFDGLLGKSYLGTRRRRDQTVAGALFAWGCAFSVLVAMAMTLHVAAAGGGPGRVLATLMAASVFVSATLFLFLAPSFMLITAAPAALCLLVLPLLPTTDAAATGGQGALGVACGVAGFLAYVLRAAFQNATLLRGLRAANVKAKDRQIEAEARRAEAEETARSTTRFLNAVTHELRTPLNAVIGYSEIIAEDMAFIGREDSARDAGRIEKSARHLLGLIDQILNVSNADAGHEGLSARELDVRALLQAAVSAHELAAREANNRLSIIVCDDAARAYTDPSKLAVCLGALLSNAVKFTHDGVIAVRAGRKGDHLVFTVSDSGPGIAAEDAERIFDPFVQLGSTKGGMGIGLTIARRMAAALGGTLVVTSQTGPGATFKLSVPAEIAPHQRASAAA